MAKQISQAIYNLGAATFLDETDIHIGDEFEERLLSALEQARELLIRITPWALDRPYVWAELGAAWLRRIPIVGVLHGLSAADLQQMPGVPVFLKQRDLVDINDIDLYLSQLASRIAQRGG